MRLTLILLLTIIFVFILQIFFLPEEVFSQFGYSYNNLLSKPWTLLTSIFIHGDLIHLLSNLFVLYFFGRALEEDLKWKMLILFLIGAIVANLASLAIYPPDVISIGASAGIFSLIGATMLIKPWAPMIKEHMEIHASSPFYLPPLGVLGFLYVLYNILAVFGPATNISYIGHIAGFIIGLIYGTRYKKIKDRKTLLTIAAIIILLILPLIFSSR